MYSVTMGERVIVPTKVVCVGRNYLDHIQELNNSVPDEMVVFNKPASSIAHQLYASHHEPLHYEAEICFLVQDGDYHGVGVGLDLTKRELQSSLKAKGLPWERAKSFDNSAVFSRFVSLQGIDMSDLQIELYINSVRVQCGHVKQMMYPPSVILDELRSYTTLCDGDIVMTGTPEGVGEVHQGDVFVCRLKCGEETLVEVEWHAQ
ncbi:fumarylacetoacetate hydrolase family protein [Vibrio sp. S4M6]|uniref:fumarylacetoacetate hydrolase family protein n=1 Tax=Vibrio sinus TaxID=2946865 RepID=UPI002029EDF6|nr:fumarylacetoacetate hydrolase family protein [Vibrio sinus]MCL9780263.1 fumarylacetoacetate hydrolase family protein [Vibrio sinus]